MKTVPYTEITNITEAVKVVVDYIFKGSNVRYNLAIQDNIRHVRVNIAQISRVIINILKNSVQSMSNGGKVTIEIKNTTVFDDKIVDYVSVLGKGNYMQISIVDDGIGISMGNLEKVFKPGFSTKQNSAGLGLAIAKSIIINHNGYIEIESEKGYGTSCHIYLPVSWKDAN